MIKTPEQLKLDYALDGTNVDGIDGKIISISETNITVSLINTSHSNSINRTEFKKLKSKITELFDNVPSFNINAHLYYDSAYPMEENNVETYLTITFYFNRKFKKKA